MKTVNKDFKIIIAPAKTMLEKEIGCLKSSIPMFINDSQIIYQKLQSLTFKQLKQLYKANDKITELNFQRLRKYKIEQGNTHAIDSYWGLVFKHIGASVLEDDSLQFINDKLYILSGLYGLLRCSDLIIPYRLEAQSPLAIGDHKDLYEFWGDKLAKHFKKETILNLASNEYDKLIKQHNSDNEIIDVSFYCLKNGALTSKTTLIKSCRGALVRYIAQNKITDIDQLKNFNDFGFEYDEKLSHNTHLVYIQKR